MRVEARDLTMVYRDAGREVEVFRDLQLSVDSGSSIAIVGESGIGKTTLLYLLGGLEQPTSGEVVIGDSSLRDLYRKKEALSSFRGKNIGLIFQFHYLLPEFDAVENVAMPLLIQGVGRREAMRRAAELLERVGLGKRLNHRPTALSGGEQQRVAIARAFAPGPGVVLADEPTGNLDGKTGGGVNAVMRQMQSQEGITLIVVTHSLELASTMDRILELTPGGLCERERAADVKSR